MFSSQFSRLCGFSSARVCAKITRMKATSTTLRKPSPYFLSSVFLCLLLGIGAFLINEIPFLNEGFSIAARMNDLEYYLTSTVFYIGFIAFVWFGKHRFHYREPVWMDFLLLGLLGCGIGGILLFPETLTLKTGYEYTFGQADRMRSIMAFIASVCMLYLCFAVGPRVTRGRRIALFCAFVLIALALSACVWSLIAEHEIIASFFSNLEQFPDVRLLSFTNNRNTFGTLLFFGVCACALWNEARPNFFWYVLMLVFELFVVLCLSRTAIFLSSIFALVYLFYRFFKTFKSHPLRNLLWAVILLGSATFMVLGGYTNVLPEAFDGFNKFVHNLVENMESTATLDARISIWQGCIAELDTPARLWLGVGYRNVNSLNHALQTGTEGFTAWTHNGIIDILVRNGIAGLIFGGIFVLILLVYLALNARKKVGLYFTYALLTIMLAMHGMSESTDFFLMDAKSLVIVLLTFFPVFSDNYERLYGREAEDGAFYGSLSFPKKVRYELSATRKATVAFYILSPFALTFLAIANPIGAHYSIDILQSIPLHLAVLAVYFCVPYIAFALSFFERKGLAFVEGFFSILLCFAAIPVSLLPYGYYALALPLLSFIWMCSATRQARYGFNGKLFRHAYLPYVLIALTTMIAAHAFDSLFAEMQSRYAIVASFFLPIVLSFFFLEATSLHEKAYYPYSLKEERSEIKAHIFLTKRALKAKQRRFQDSLRACDRRAERRRYKHNKTYLYPTMGFES